MATIIEIQESTVIIEAADGRRELPKGVFNFTPAVGDEIKIFTSGINTAVLKLEPAESSNKFVNFLRKNFLRKSKPVRKSIYIIFALFFGGMGIHKIYAGKIGVGVAYMLLSWTSIPGCLVLIDIILALFKKSDSDKRITVW